jgi:AcrR family transcriptional regulator
VLKLADTGGFQSLSMRKVAAKLRVEALSLYNHVASKEDIIDGIVFGEIEAPTPGSVDWRTAMRGRAMSARSTVTAGRSD